MNNDKPTDKKYVSENLMTGGYSYTIETTEGRYRSKSYPTKQEAQTALNEH